MDDTRPPPPQGPPPTYAFVTRVYRRNLRPVILIIAGISSLWALVWAVGSFRAMKIPGQAGSPKFATFSLVLGILYMTAFVIQTLGVVAAFTQRITLIRLYAFLSVLSALVVIGAGLLRTITHFMFKSELISECTSLATGEEVIYRYGFWGPVTYDNLTPEQAARWCQNEWGRDSWTEIVSVICEAIAGAFFTAVSFAYYRQSLDPTSPANASRTPSGRTGEYPSHYNPPYDAPAPTYAPPPGPPPPPGAGDDAKPPGYGFGAGPDYDAQGKFKREKEDDPFADFEAPPTQGARRDERV